VLYSRIEKLHNLAYEDLKSYNCYKWISGLIIIGICVGLKPRVRTYFKYHLFRSELLKKTNSMVLEEWRLLGCVADV
jgi:hypothetical protein